MNIVFRVIKYVGYLLRAKTKYYLHSPFVYQFYLNVLEGDEEPYLEAIDLLRNELKNDNTPILQEDLGTGTAKLTTVAAIEKNVTVRPKYGRLLYRLVKYFRPATVLELGASIGVSSTYLAMANGAARVVSLEGTAAVAKVATQNHVLLGVKNVDIITGNFDETLNDALNDFEQLGLVFFDGNHTKEATLRYFLQCLQKADENTIFVFDDIYWSRDMNEAWEEIKKHKKITLTLDVYQFGICFFRKGKLAKEDFVLLY